MGAPSEWLALREVSPRRVIMILPSHRRRSGSAFSDTGARPIFQLPELSLRVHDTRDDMDDLGEIKA